MDEASKLVSELQHKLSELDQKVVRYRRDMVLEFEKYAERLLQGVPTEVSETVSKTVSEAIKGYRSLYPEAAIESRAAGSNVLQNAFNSDRVTQLKMPSAAQTQDPSIEEGPRSPHEREKEFQGVFTPSYLPLLDSTTRNEGRSNTEPATSPQYDINGKGREVGHVDVDERAEIHASTVIQGQPRPPTPKRRNTDELSIQSDWSDSAPRRSALRRSSSSSNGRSPRQVRFSVAGMEVLPTASPHADPILAEDNTPMLGGSDEEAGLEQIEDVDDSPPPKRISSSQALRALSRSPLVDDGTTWTTVSALPDGSPSVATANGSSQDSSSENFQNGNGKSRFTLGTRSPPLKIAGTSRSFPRKDVVEDQTETPSDDEMLDMAPLTRQSPSAAKVLSPLNPPDIDNDKSPTSSTRSPNKPLHSIERPSSTDANIGAGMRFDEDDNDEVFSFEENHRQHQNRTAQAEEGTEEGDDDNDTDTEVPNTPQPSETVPDLQTGPLSHYSTSPATDIHRFTSLNNHSPISKGVVGSYKGRPFSMDVVNPEVHAQAASMGDINSFVGSLDGRSGFDESDVQSFRESGGIGIFSGTPRSMSERMMMDDIHDAERAERAKRRSQGN